MVSLDYKSECWQVYFPFWRLHRRIIFVSCCLEIVYIHGFTAPYFLQSQQISFLLSDFLLVYLPFKDVLRTLALKDFRDYTGATKYMISYLATLIPSSTLIPLCHVKSYTLGSGNEGMDNLGGWGYHSA